MSEKEATEEQINDTLTKIMTSDPNHSVKFLAKILFNVRFDLDELKLHLKKMLKDVSGEGYCEFEELQFPDKKITTTPERLNNDFYS